VDLSEFHLRNASHAFGDLEAGLGPEFRRFNGGISTRAPGGGLGLIDRVVTLPGRRGDLRPGRQFVTEYDSPADAWYYRDSANASLPNVVLMESSLQQAVFPGYYLGPTLADLDERDPHRVRNLGGHLTVLREVETQDRTIRQFNTLQSTTKMPGTILQEFAFHGLLVGDDEPFYTSESTFGFHTGATLAQQVGLDNGQRVPTWLEQQAGKVSPRTVSLAARRADPDDRLCSRDHLALLDEIQVVDGGGQYGQGYLYSAQAMDPTAWYFERHFAFDPVIPGSIGVETVLQAMQEWALDAGFAAELVNPAFVLPVGVRLGWKYRGQFIPTDADVTLEVHIKSVERRPGRVRVIGDANMWKPTMRIYALTGVAVELREEGAQPW
jgi:3-hydroxymyristoyl/3-hydroxydecanoyl-(acyl carrier protein) dehydratase